MADLRTFVDSLRDRDKLTCIAGADWDLEIGGISKIARREGHAKAILFDEVPSYEPGYRVLTNVWDTPYTATAALGYQPTSDMREAVVAHKEKASISTAVDPTTVSTGPILSNVHRGDDIDLFDFPAPKWHEGDGGRYIGTGDVVITRDAETGSINAGTYRVQVQGPNKATVQISPGKDGKRNERSYLDRDEPFPLVVSLGQSPDLFAAANERLPGSVNELEYAGARRGEPIEVIEGDVTGLPMPSRAEIVLEGHVYPDEEPVEEGPFGEWTGYYASGTQSIRPMTIEQVYHRDDPIILGYTNNINKSAISVMRSASRLWAELEEAGVPGIGAVNALRSGSWFHVVSIDQQYGGHATQVGMQAISSPTGAYHGRFTVVVDDDIDVFDRDEVMWALTSRCDPERDITIVEDCWSTPLDPSIPPGRKADGDYTNSQAVIDATRPYSWREEFPDDIKLSPKLESELLDRFGEELNGQS